MRRFGFLFLLTLLWLIPVAAQAQIGPPVANNKSVQVSTVGTTLIQLEGSDPDGTALVFATPTSPTHGTLSQLNTATGTVLYTPTANYTGPDSFTYTVTSGGTTTSPATVSITVTNGRTRIIDILLNPDSTPRVGKVTFILTQTVTAPDGLTPISSTVTSTLNAAGQFDISVYPSRSLFPQAYYQVWFADANSVRRELIGVYDIPASTNTVALGPYKVIDTNLAARYVFMSQAAAESMINRITTLNVQVNSSFIGQQQTLNLIPGSNVTISGVNNTGAGKVDVTINSTGGAGGGTVNTGSAGALGYYTAANQTINPLAIGAANTILGANNAGTAPEYKTLVAGSNVTITHAAGQVTIAANTAAAITSLGGQTGATQTFNGGSGGTDVNVTSASNVHTINVPTLTLSAIRGLMSHTAQRIGGDKTWEGNHYFLAGGITLAGSVPTFQAATYSDSNLVLGRGLSSSLSSSTADAAFLTFIKSRGTHAAPTAVANADYIGRAYSMAYDGASYKRSSWFGFAVDGTVATGAIPVAIEFWTGSTASLNGDQSLKRGAFTSDGTFQAAFNGSTAKVKAFGDGTTYGKTFEVMQWGDNVVGAIFRANTGGTPTVDILQVWDKDSTVRARWNKDGDFIQSRPARFNSYMDFGGLADPGVSGAGTARIYYDATANKLKLSNNGAAFIDVGSGGGSSFYQTVQVAGAAQTQRPAVNFIAGSNVTLSGTDNAAQNRTDITITSSSGAGGGMYQTMQNAGSSQTQRGKLNFLPGTNVNFTFGDDLGNDRTNLTIVSLPDATAVQRTGATIPWPSSTQQRMAFLYDTRNSQNFPLGLYVRSQLGYWSPVSQCVNIADYGAIGDGNPLTGAGTDNTDAIQRAMNAAQWANRDEDVQKGGCVIAQGGYFRIKKPLVLWSFENKAIPQRETLRFIGAGMERTVIFNTEVPTTLTGTVTISGTNLTGSSTLFTTELVVGDQVQVGSDAGALFRIASITNNTTATVSVNSASLNLSGVNAYKPTHIFLPENLQLNKIQFYLEDVGLMGRYSLTSPPATNFTTPQAGIMMYNTSNTTQADMLWVNRVYFGGLDFGVFTNNTQSSRISNSYFNANRQVHLAIVDDNAGSATKEPNANTVEKSVFSSMPSGGLASIRVYNGNGLSLIGNTIQGNGSGGASNRTGTISIDTAGNVTGSGTLFTKQLARGVRFKVSSAEYFVNSISSDTSATVRTASGSSTTTSQSAGSSYSSGPVAILMDSVKGGRVAGGWIEDETTTGQAVVCFACAAVTIDSIHGTGQHEVDIDLRGSTGVNVMSPLLTNSVVNVRADNGSQGVKIHPGILNDSWLVQDFTVDKIVKEGVRYQGQTNTAPQGGNTTLLYSAPGTNLIPNALAIDDASSWTVNATYVTRQATGGPAGGGYFQFTPGTGSVTTISAAVLEVSSATIPDAAPEQYYSTSFDFKINSNGSAGYVDIFMQMFKNDGGSSESYNLRIDGGQTKYPVNEWIREVITVKLRAGETGRYFKFGFASTSQTGTGVPQVQLANPRLHAGTVAEAPGYTQLLGEVNNIIRDNGSIQFGSSGTKITKHFSGTASLDFTGLAANSCESFTITVTGAADGDTVVLGVPNSISSTGGTLFGYVSAANVVTVRRCNPTGSALSDPAAATVRSDVWRH